MGCTMPLFCGPCRTMTIFPPCECVEAECPETTKCKAGQSPELGACGCKTCGGAEEVKTALEEEAQEEMVEEAENRSR